MNRKHGLIFVMVAAAALLAGCPKRVKPDAPASTTVNTPPPATTPPVASSGIPTVDMDTPRTGGSTPPGALGPDSMIAAQRVIYCDFDSNDIRNEFVNVIAEHGRFLARNATVRVRLEGHTDERGSREYNIGLAERRSQTVKRALMLQGVQETQIATVSYGEERPAAAGSDEAAWSKNRRVEVVYIN